MPEVKMKHKSQPVLNAAQQQMQQSFVCSKQEHAAHRQSESPSDYAEEKVSRTAENAVRDVGTFARESVRTIRQQADDPANMGSVPFSESSPGYGIFRQSCCQRAAFPGEAPRRFP